MIRLGEGGRARRESPPASESSKDLRPAGNWDRTIPRGSPTAAAIPDRRQEEWAFCGCANNCRSGVVLRMMSIFASKMLELF
jgi:hypothetical protein